MAAIRWASTRMESGKAILGLFLVSVLLAPTLSWSAQPTIRIAQAADAAWR